MDRRALTPIALALTCLTLRAAPETADLPELPVSEVLQRALATAEADDPRDVQKGYRLRLQRVSEKLDADGEVKEREEKVYDVFPIQGRWFERLVEKDGEPLDARQQAREEERQRRFARRRAEGKESSESKQEVRFDRQLVDKYDWEMLPAELVDGRPSYVLGYRPRSRDLPVRNRMDYALNKAEGRMWVDGETFQLARVQFELKERVRLWWGILGSISRLRGSLQRRPVADGVWLPRRFDLYMDGRILFTSLHQRQQVTWTGVEQVDAAAGAGN